ncbi:uncharacterized protein LOC125945333 [Dermacentor silvarum]|uniref:uncharacterized protein LOC125945333 n=1 Tax=Dermacentor silvarum TaxID=543639 RepID=UPI002100B4E2|nr:uncharacterized protein LOC125945333 [Dermacentor silvarum]
MGERNIAAVSAISLAILVVRSTSSPYECGPYCPPENTTMNSCVTTCPNDDKPFDPFNVKEAWFKNGTPCWRNETGIACVGMCCGGECELSSACENDLNECPQNDSESSEK